MKNKVLSVGTAALLAIGGVTAGSSVFASQQDTAPKTQQSQQKQQTSDQGKQAAKTAQNKFGGDVVNVETDTDNGQKVYEVELANSKNGRIEVDVSQSTGKIIDVDQTSKDDNSDDNKDDKEKDEQVNPKQVNVDQKQAKQQALKETGANKVTEIELENENGTATYDIDATDKSGQKYEVTINAENGKVVNIENEKKDNDSEAEDDKDEKDQEKADDMNDEQNDNEKAEAEDEANENEEDQDDNEANDKDQDEQVNPKQVNISKKQAQNTAVHKAGGNKATDIELESENGTATYDINTQDKNGNKVEVTINAENGKVMTIEKEDNDENEADEDKNEKEDEQNENEQEGNEQEDD